MLQTVILSNCVSPPEGPPASPCPTDSEPTQIFLLATCMQRNHTSQSLTTGHQHITVTNTWTSTQHVIKKRKFLTHVNQTRKWHIKAITVSSQNSAHTFTSPTKLRDSVARGSLGDPNDKALPVNVNQFRQVDRSPLLPLRLFYLQRRW